MGEALRTAEQQALYHESGRSKVKVSQHQKKLALDLNLFVRGRYCTDKEEYRVVGEEWERLGGRWGGRFGVKRRDYTEKIGWDAGHFEWRG